MLQLHLARSDLLPSTALDDSLVEDAFCSLLVLLLVPSLQSGLPLSLLFFYLSLALGVMCT